MIRGAAVITFAGETLHLLPERAVWWPARATLIIADPHFGKAASFRTMGLPVPAGTTTSNVRRLTSLLEQTEAGQLIILGDFLHAKTGRHDEVFNAIAQWRTLHASLPIKLIRGNHDRSAGRVPDDWNILEVEEPYTDGGFSFLHTPECPAPNPAFAGHVHPIVSLVDFDRSTVRRPCFVLEDRLIILPAFGSFTGGYCVPAFPGRQRYVLAGDRVIAIGQRPPG